MNMPLLARPEDVENAFYEAIAHADLDALMALWADDEEIVCVLPDGRRLEGMSAIRERWRALFAATPRITVRLSQPLHWTSMLLAVHHVIETFYTADDPAPKSCVLATNVFQRGVNGWRLLAHHASAAAEFPDSDETGAPGLAQRVLH
ncbi:nuclear transport factor 2 family protein [Rhodocyclus tenuis]|uniref:Nuclear transport factor 2 family protein n=1 Tax=Rhodocyclus gracilis TaxID=2929842 RepID=A0ABX0WED3_9RHOO|nr:nuclear transport factor 2 family protein [Rhodocyclus gracilis]NJA88092.1 nuclear transport factor 2 family protein [Rhodocyclus gracilis]